MSTKITPALLALASPQELAEYTNSLKRELALLSPLDYAQTLYPDRVQRFAHTELLNRYAVALTERSLYETGISEPAIWLVNPEDPEDGYWAHPETKERAVDILVVSAPPRHGKSYLLTEMVPSWYLSKYPNHKVAVTGYEAEFAKGFGRKNRENLNLGSTLNPPLSPPVSANTRAADNWEVEGTGGKMATAGAGGPLSGKGFNLIVIDDPVKNSAEALSPTSRQTNWDWWLSTVKNRLEFKPEGTREPQRECGVCINIQTRWHEDDLAGRMIRNERCFVLNLPALAFEDCDPDTGISRDPETGVPDPLGRAPGQPLCASLFTRTRLQEIRENGDDTGENPGGTLWFSAMYQGKPTTEGGGILPKPFLHASTSAGHTTVFYNLQGSERANRTDCIMFGIADMANSVKKRADFTAMSYWAYTPQGNLLLLDAQRFRMESPDHELRTREFWRAMQAKHGPGRFLGIEDRTFGTTLIQNMMRSGGIAIRPLKADKDKIERAIPAGSLMREGKVWFRDDDDTNGPDGFLADFEKELAAFPNATHDDYVDNLSYAVSVSRTLPIRATRPVSEESPNGQAFVSDILAKYDKQKGNHAGGKRKGLPSRTGRAYPVLGRW